MSVLKRFNGTSWETIGPGITSARFDSTNAMIAPEYDSSQTYNVGDYVVQSNNLYRCIVKINTPEAWYSSHWTKISLGEDLTELRNNVVAVSDTQPVDGNNRIWIIPDNNDIQIPCVEDVMMLPSANNYGTPGQYPRSTGSGIEWTDYGLPSDEQTAEAIEVWLDNHPEATTTVEDESLTFDKFTYDTKRRLSYLFDVDATPRSNEKKICWNTLFSNVGSVETARSQVLNCSKLFNYTVHAPYSIYSPNSISENTGNITIQQTIDTLRYSEDLGMPIRCIKLHASLTRFINSVGREQAYVIYKNYIDDIIERYSEFNPEYITILNEDAEAYSSSANAEIISQLLEYIRTNGYKASITLRTDGLSNIYAPIIDHCDVFCLNWYPVFSIRENNFNYFELEEHFKAIAKHTAIVKENRVPVDKKFIISEFGICNNWLALRSPETYYSYDQHRSTASSIPQYWIYKLFFKYLYNIVDELWAWYYVDMYQNRNTSFLFNTLKYF